MKGMSINKYKINLNLVPKKSETQLTEIKIAELKQNFNKAFLPSIENPRDKRFSINSSYSNNPSLSDNKIGNEKLS
jgi:hypothetical protein